MSKNVYPLKKPLRNLTPELCIKLQEEMMSACRSVAEQHGLVIAKGDIEKMDLRHGFEFPLKVSIPKSDGSFYDAEREKFAVFASAYGLSAQDYGREFFDGNDWFRITGIQPRRPKYPIDAERLSDRRQFKLSEDMVVHCLSQPHRTR